MRRASSVEGPVNYNGLTVAQRFHSLLLLTSLMYTAVLVAYDPSAWDWKRS